MITQDFKQRIKVGAIFLLQVYKVTTGTLLSLFIPQACVDEDGSNKIIVRGLPQFTHQISNGSSVNIKRVSDKALLFNQAGMRVQFTNA